MQYNKNFYKILHQYDYKLPSSQIALSPAKPRDSAQLLICNRQNNKLQTDTFANLTKYLPYKSVIVFNQTKVIPARLELTKPTGGKVRILFLEKGNGVIKVLADRKLEVGTELFIGTTIKPSLRGARQSGRRGNLSFTVHAHAEKCYTLKPLFPLSKINSILQTYGQTPIPPYLKHTKLSEIALRKNYQTIFARTLGSVAAPTASLHFTKNLLTKLKNAGHQIEFVTLHVNLGTFAPLTKEHMQTGQLHHETYFIDKNTARRLNQAKYEGRQIVAVGTTVVRTLESASHYNVNPEPSRGASRIFVGCHSRAGGNPQQSLVKLTQLTGSTNLFIQPGYKFKFVDNLITNFHVPKSSLMMLVAAFYGREKLLKTYQGAIKKRFRFFSFGDGMLIN
ncbi:MAG: tRNA preQ1(34) S-adenosylmethionine ribosyltransferase-isomerase QueA [Patescibacteria group bacterium]